VHIGAGFAQGSGVDKFNGQWQWKVASGAGPCNLAIGDPVTIESGKISGQIQHGSDTGLGYMSGTIDADGTIRTFAQGSYVFVKVTGKAEGKNAEGVADVAGDANCQITWKAWKLD
ncbi:MAG: hypothetical protein OQJ76_08385, partial [Rhodospirillales bacterium]|nr:hypothetical protein [Rhodospirillales bacterium]